jgi:Lar family restriction alleviation protein
VANEQPSTEAVDLTPCPFCGGPAEHHKTQHQLPGEQLFHWIACQKCESGAGAYNSVESAKAAWNHRFAPEPREQRDPADPANLTVPYGDLQAHATHVLKLEAALEEACQSCACSVRERDSGHRVDCGVPAWRELLEQSTMKEGGL